MRIACPSCAAEYNVPDRLLTGAARTLRCSRCGTDFPLPGAPAAVAPPPAPAPVVEAPPAPPPAPEAPPEPAPVAAPALSVPERTPVAREDHGNRVLMAAWAASLLVVLGGVAAMVLFRSQLMVAWPPATRLFAVLGLA